MRQDGGLVAQNATAAALTSTPGVINIVNPEIEIFLHFARRPDELAAFMASDPALRVQLAEDTAILRSQGIWAAMQFSKEIHDGKHQQLRSSGFCFQTSKRRLLCYMLCVIVQACRRGAETSIRA